MSYPIIDTKKGESGSILHVLAGDDRPEVGSCAEIHIDWQRRYRHMRMHTALHLLCSLVDGDVTGGQIGAEHSRLDFNIPGSAVDKQTLTEQLNRLVVQDYPVSASWITDQELDDNPGMVRTLSVKPPRGNGQVRLVRIHGIDTQPCGGTHVASTSEVGGVEIAKIENKGKQNRRITVRLIGASST